MPGAWGRLGPVAPPDLRLVLKPVPAAGASWEPPSPLGYSLLWVLEMAAWAGPAVAAGHIRARSPSAAPNPCHRSLHRPGHGRVRNNLSRGWQALHGVPGQWLEGRGGLGLLGAPPAQPEGCLGLRVPRCCPSPTPTPGAPSLSVPCACTRRAGAGFSSASSTSLWLGISAKPLPKNDLPLRKVSRSVSLSTSSSGTAGLRGSACTQPPQRGRFGLGQEPACHGGPPASTVASLCPPPAVFLCHGDMLRTAASLNSEEVGAVTQPRPAAVPTPACVSSAMFMQSSVNSSQRCLGLQSDGFYRSATVYVLMEIYVPYKKMYRLQEKNGS